MNTFLRNVVVVAAAILCGGLLADVSFAVKDVEAHQRYPWNGKVDIDFTLESDDPSDRLRATFECMDNVGNTNIVMKSIRYNDTGTVATAFALLKGKHRITWDADIDAPNMKIPSVSFTAIVESDSAVYLVIDLSGGPDATSYPVTTLDSIPSGGWTDEYKATKLVLRRCPAGDDPLGRYTLTKDFYVGVFEVTQRQWYLVMGTRPSYRSGDFPDDTYTYPVECVSYDMIRGSSIGANWPSSSAVDSTSFIGKLRTKTGIGGLDLPTEAQWEYACRAGTTTTYNTGDSETALTNAGWYRSGSTYAVGLKTANAWGLYDMHGNVWEWCLDWEGESLTGDDPVGAVSGSNRHVRGGSWVHFAAYTTSSCRIGIAPSRNDYYNGFRLFRTVP